VQRAGIPRSAIPSFINNRGMATPSPSSLFDQLFDRVGRALQPPAWLVEELQRRLVLLLNHVLQQEPEAQARLKRQAGRLVEAHWRGFSVRLQATPAGLLDLGSPALAPDLTLTLTDDSPWSLAQTALRGDKPAVTIAGDVQLAAEVQWLVDHVRWDLEEDLSRLVGDVPAHAIGNVLHRMAGALRQFAAKAAPGGAGSGRASGESKGDSQGGGSGSGASGGSGVAPPAGSGQAGG
jgi:ubiquinone biosynthesis protein UbiJ